MWRGIEKNAYIFNNEFPGGEVVVTSSWRDRDAMWYKDISEKTRFEIYLDE